MRAVIEPRWTSKLASSTARTPPNALETSWTSSTGSRAAGRSVTEHHLLALSEEPLRAESHQQDQEKPDEHEADRLDVLGAQRQLDEARAFEERPHHDRPDRDAPVIGEAAQHQH